MKNKTIDLDNLPPAHGFSYTVSQGYNRMFHLDIYRDKEKYKRVSFHDALSAFKYLVELEENKK